MIIQKQGIHSIVTDSAMETEITTMVYDHIERDLRNTVMCVMDAPLRVARMRARLHLPLQRLFNDIRTSYAVLRRAY